MRCDPESTIDVPKIAREAHDIRLAQENLLDDPDIRVVIANLRGQDLKLKMLVQATTSGMQDEVASRQRDIAMNRSRTSRRYR